MWRGAAAHCRCNEGVAVQAAEDDGPPPPTSLQGRTEHEDHKVAENLSNWIDYSDTVLLYF